MRLNLILQATCKRPMLTLNYQYPLSAAVYKVIQRADAGFSAFLHDTGYGAGHKHFKLFTFSDLRTPFTINGDRMVMQSDRAQLTICFHIPQAAETFIRGLFLQQQIDIADNRSKVTFVVQQVESIPGIVHTGFGESSHKHVSVVVQPLSPLVTGRKNDKGYYDYRSPLDADFTDCLLHNWLEKYKVAYDADAKDIHQIKEDINIKVQLYPHPPKQRLITIKQGTAEATCIKGYTKFRLQLTAPGDFIQLAFDAGMGLYNSMGCGCMGVV